MLSNDVITQQLGRWVAQPHFTWNWFYDMELDEVVYKKIIHISYLRKVDQQQEQTRYT